MNNTDDKPQVEVKRVKACIIYRLMLIGFGIPMVGFSFICGVMGIFGYDMVKWNNQTIHGLLALPTALFSGLFVSVLMTVFLGSIACLGLWIYSRFRPLQVKVLD
ncbi:hypothetical protein DUQ00_02495 [Salmonella bongori]|nr:hypothetical protein [Salmonella bongori]EGE4655414.1 hypothetical protein [Salmonella bongori serovar 40:z35:- str. 95-0123]EGE4658214.1 hypothetical protein [Salmonella bongori serovar 48:i:- str. 94-0708]EGS1129007.1 hypothetical protein [Salmonella bongori CFSAN000509]HAC6693139.1 hypothetical protein [Salmonella bongori serovar 44:r:-]AID27598.1 hypothetical protein N643_16200 [Salmonella bongori serovar 48:z41:-- str. RKS3044]